MSGPPSPPGGPPSLSGLKIRTDSTPQAVSKPASQSGDPNNLLAQLKARCNLLHTQKPNLSAKVMEEPPCPPVLSLKPCKYDRQLQLWREYTVCEELTNLTFQEETAIINHTNFSVVTWNIFKDGPKPEVRLPEILKILASVNPVGLFLCLSQF